MASSLVFLVLAACIRRLADTVDKRSSLNSTGISVRLDSSRTKASTFSACLPMLPSIERGRPTIICLTCCWLIILVIASTSTVSSIRLIIVSGLANMPPGSLRATPILLSPISRPRLRVILHSCFCIKLFIIRRTSSSLSLFLPPPWASVGFPPPPPPVILVISFIILTAL